MTKHQQYHKQASMTSNGWVARQPAARRSQPTPWLWIALIAALVIFAAVAIAHSYGFVTLWEDGSFRLFSLTGCLPGGICQ